MSDDGWDGFNAMYEQLSVISILLMTNLEGASDTAMGEVQIANNCGPRTPEVHVGDEE